MIFGILVSSLLLDRWKTSLLGDWKCPYRIQAIMMPCYLQENVGRWILICIFRWMWYIYYYFDRCSSIRNMWRISYFMQTANYVVRSCSTYYLYNRCSHFNDGVSLNSYYCMCENVYCINTWYQGIIMNALRRKSIYGYTYTHILSYPLLWNVKQSHKDIHISIWPKSNAIHIWIYV